MRDLLDWLLGQRTLRFGDEGVRFTMTYELAPWQWALIATAAILAGSWCYRRIEGPRWWRSALAAARAALLLLLAFLAAGPRLTRPNETVERDWVIVLADRSASLRIADVQAPGSSTPQTRDDQLKTVLAAHQAGLAAAQRGRVSLWLGFDSGAYELKPAAGSNRPAASTPDLPDALGRRSDLGAAIEAALARAAARPVSGIVVLSDGRATDAISRATLRRLAAERIGVYPVALGSPDPLTDLAVRSVQGPGMAFINDVVPVEAVIERIGSAAKAATAMVQLVDSLTGKVLDEREIRFDPSPDNQAPDADAARTRRLTLTGSPSTAGAAQWRIRVVPTGPDLVADNNAADLTIDLVDRPLRIIYLDGYPRWEYRYLKNLLAREKSMSYSALLLAAGRRFLAEGGGDEPLTLPNTPEEWNRYDVIVMGDLRPDVLTPEQLEQIKRRVLVGGAGLLWIGGDGATPLAWRSTTLADLLPMSLSSDGASLRPWDQDVVMRPTPSADRLGVMRLLERPADGSWWPASISDPSSGWSRIRWAQRIERQSLKPAVEVLAEALPASTGPAPTALVSTMRYGSGRIVYVATDEIWRWRYGRGEDLPERFWLQIIRLLGREAVARSGRPALLTLSPSRGEVNQPVRVSVELIDQRLLDSAPATIAVRIGRIGDAAHKPVDAPPSSADSVELVLRPSSEPGSGEGRRIFSGVWVPTQTGLFRAVISDALLSGDNITADAEIWLPDDELRRPEADHSLLASLARDTGGRMLTGPELDRLDQILPRREVRLAGIPDEQTLWDCPLALILLILLATWEWVGRRLIRLA